MYDIKWIRENPEAFDTGLKRRGLEPPEFAVFFGPLNFDRQSQAGQDLSTRILSG